MSIVNLYRDLMQRLNRAKYIDIDAVFNIRRTSLTLRDGSRRSSGSAFQIVRPHREGPATECARGTVKWCRLAERMVTSGDVEDWNTAVDQVFRCSVLQTLEHRDCDLVLHQCTK